MYNIDTSFPNNSHYMPDLRFSQWCW